MLNKKIMLAICLIMSCAQFISPYESKAQVDPWEFEVYPYATLGRGMLEVESLNAVPLDGHKEPGAGTAGGIFASRHQWYTSLEVAYGLTDRIEVAGYATFALPDGDSFQYAGLKYRLRGRLADEGVLPVDIGWYAEIEKHRSPQFDDVENELELRPIMEKTLGRFSLMLNPIFEKPLVNEGWEFGYAAGVSYRLEETVSPGIEFYGGLGPIGNIEPSSEQQHYIVPVIHGKLGQGLEYNTGVGFGLTSGSDKVIFKFNLELEKFIGSLFGPSNDNGWLF